MLARLLRGGGWARDLRRTALLLAAGTLVGALTGALALSLAVVLALLLAWHLLHLYRLALWMQDRQGTPRALERAGVWHDLYVSLHGMQRRNRKRRKRVRKLITRFQNAAWAFPDGAVVLGENGNIEWSNPAAGTLLGLRYPGDKHQRIVNLVRNPAFTRYVDAGEFDEPMELSSPVDRDVKLSVLIVPYGKDRHLLIARNVTRVKILERAHKDFVANVSHELRTPLTVIVGYLESLGGDEAMPEPWKRPFEQMSQQSARMCAIVEDLLKLSGLESSPEAAPLSEVEPVGMLQSVAADARNLSGGRHEIGVSGEGEAPLLGDYNELYSAVSNLVFNAVQYTPDGGSIDLRWVEDPPGAGRARDGGPGGRIEVRDTGIGIDAHHLPRLTERFYRAEKARSRELGGTGLGLAIVKHVLLRHGATLEIESAVGEGSTFACVFPPARVKSSAAEPEAAQGAGAAAHG